MFSADNWSMLVRTSARLTGYAIALTRDRDRARDLVQDAILRAVQSGNVPCDETVFRIWFMRILRNLSIDLFRGDRRREALMPVCSQDVADLPSTQHSEELLLNHMVVRQAFFALSANHRDVLALVDIAGFSYDETAQILDVNRGTIMSRVSRARMELLKQLSDERVVPFPVARHGGTA